MVGALLLGTAGVVHAGDKVVMDIGERWVTPTREVETPHIKWAKPRAQGRLRVLFLGEQNKMREVVELAQRLDMDYEFWGAGGRNADDLFRCGIRVGWFKGDAPGDKLKRLKRILRDGADYDLIVMGEIQWHGLPLFARYQILKRVKDGTGLVRVYTGKGSSGGKFYSRARKPKMAIPPEAMAGVPWKALPVFAGHADTAAFLNGTLRAYRFGKGTIVEIVGYKVPDAQLVTPGFTRDPLTLIWYRNWAVTDHSKYPDYDMPITDVKFLDYDYYAAWFIKVMLFAAGQAPGVTVSGDGLVREVAREALSQITFTVTVPDTPDIPFLTADFTLRDRDNNVLATARKDKLGLKPGENTISFPVSNVPGSSYFADLWIKRGGETLGFGSQALRVTSKTRIKDVRLASDHFRVGETIMGEVVIEESGDKIRDLRLDVRQTDNFGRLVGHSAFRIPRSAFHITLPPSRRRPLSTSTSLWTSFPDRTSRTGNGCPSRTRTSTSPTRFTRQYGSGRRSRTCRSDGMSSSTGPDSIHPWSVTSGTSRGTITTGSARVLPSRTAGSRSRSSPTCDMFHP